MSQTDQKLIDSVNDAVMSRGGKRSGRAILFRCPFPGHEDEHPSCSWDPEKLQFFCHVCKKGGGINMLAALLGFKASEADSKIVAEFNYYDANRVLLYQVVRVEPGRDGRRKDFYPRHKCAGSKNGDGWTYGLGGNPEKCGCEKIKPVVYGFHDLASRPGEEVDVHEGEAKAEAGLKLGRLSISAPFGASKWSREFTELLRGRPCVNVFPDNDKPGEQHANDVATSCHEAGIPVKIVKLPGLPEKGDVLDWLQANPAKPGAHAGAIGDIVKATPLWGTAKKKERKPLTISEIKAKRTEYGLAKRIKTSVPGLDELLDGGFAEGRVVTVGAFTSHGKTFLLSRESLHKAIMKHPTLFITAEQGDTEILDRIELSMDREPPDDMPLVIFEYPRGMDELESVITKWHKENPKELPGIVVVDFIQAIPISKQHSREREVAVLMECIQRMSRELRLLFIVGAQLNRDSQRDEEPGLIHLRESGTLEQFSDVVLLLQKMSNDQLRILVKKNRQGPSGGQLDLTVNFRTLDLGPISPETAVMPLAENIERYIKASGGKALIRDVLRNVKIGKLHPKKSDVFNAGMLSKLFEIDGDYVKSRQ